MVSFAYLCSQSGEDGVGAEVRESGFVVETLPGNRKGQYSRCIRGVVSAPTLKVREAALMTPCAVGLNFSRSLTRLLRRFQCQHRNLVELPFLGAKFKPFAADNHFGHHRYVYRSTYLPTYLSFGPRNIPEHRHTTYFHANSLHRLFRFDSQKRAALHHS